MPTPTNDELLEMIVSLQAKVRQLEDRLALVERDDAQAVQDWLNAADSGRLA